MMNAILVSKDGKLLAMNKPEKFELCNDCQTKPEYAEIKCLWCRTDLEKYNNALQSSISAAEDEQVEFKDNIGGLVMLVGKLDHANDEIVKDWINDHQGETFACPSGWEIRVETQNFKCHFSDESMNLDGECPKKNICNCGDQVALLVRVEEKEERKPIELPDLPQEDKDKIMKQALETASYCLLFAMRVTKSENFITGTLNNNGTEYELSFKRLPLPSPPSNP